MKVFMDKDFLLGNETAKKLYHDYAEAMPIYDYHCHLSAQEIAEDKTYRNMTELWLGGDHYKWRVLRSNGVTEDYITGDQPDKDKFFKFAETMPYTLGNPMYHWAHLELQRYFDIDETLSKANAEAIWDRCNAMLATENFTARKLIERSNVKALCTTDDPTDDLKWHKIIAGDKDFDVKVLPTFRPDQGINIDRESFLPWLKKLEGAVGYEIISLDQMIKAMIQRVDYFHEIGCRLADHGLDRIDYGALDYDKASQCFEGTKEGFLLGVDFITAYKSVLTNELGKAYFARGWVMQLHIGALRNNNQRMYEALGPDIGFDSIADRIFAEDLSRMLNDLDKTDQLPKTIIYNLNPRDNYVIGTMIGNFQGGGIPGKIQFGSGWWFCDQKEGMEAQMKSLASLGLLSRFVGMLTDSRSFLSYTRHEYFRRILCNLIGTWVENGEYPADMDFLGEMVEGICFNNAAAYFEIDI